MLDKLKDKDLEVTVSVWNSSSPEGVRYKPFTVRVASDAIDEWIAYRLIEPGYEGWNMLGIYQRISLRSKKRRLLLIVRIKVSA